MYKIIGADGKEYGPITADQIRQWLAEGRVNGRTRTRAEGATDWKTLAEFPEFAATAGVAAVSPPGLPPLGTAPGVTREAAARAARGPAIALIVVAILNLLIGVFAVSFMDTIKEFYAGMPEFKEPDMQKGLQLLFGPASRGVFVLGSIMSVVILIGAVRMLALKYYALACTVSILALIPCVTPCCLLGLPFGIWALVVLSRPDVKSRFG